MTPLPFNEIAAFSLKIQLASSRATESFGWKIWKLAFFRHCEDLLEVNTPRSPSDDVEAYRPEAVVQLLHQIVREFLTRSEKSLLRRSL